VAPKLTTLHNSVTGVQKIIDIINCRLQDPPQFRHAWFYPTKISSPRSSFSFCREVSNLHMANTSEYPSEAQAYACLKPHRPLSDGRYNTSMVYVPQIGARPSPSCISVFVTRMDNKLCLSPRPRGAVLMRKCAVRMIALLITIYFAGGWLIDDLDMMAE
jgi:hypothetical protein